MHHIDGAERLQSRRDRVLHLLYAQSRPFPSQGPEQAEAGTHRRPCSHGGCRGPAGHLPLAAGPYSPKPVDPAPRRGPWQRQKSTAHSSSRPRRQPVGLPALAPSARFKCTVSGPRRRPKGGLPACVKEQLRTALPGLPAGAHRGALYAGASLEGAPALSRRLVAACGRAAMPGRVPRTRGSQGAFEGQGVRAAQGDVRRISGPGRRAARRVPLPARHRAPRRIRGTRRAARPGGAGNPGAGRSRPAHRAHRPSGARAHEI